MFANRFQHTCDIGVNFGIWETYCVVTLFVKIYIALLIIILMSSMAIAVQFDEQLQFFTGKIGYVRSYRDLSTKFEIIELAIAQFFPKKLFNRRRIVPHLAGVA